MNHNRRDAVLLDKLLGEISDIETFIHELDETGFIQSKVVQKAVTMTLINIGELSKSFSESFLERTNQVQWRDIRGLRNLAAHHYEAVDMQDIWFTIIRDIPDLKTTLLFEQARLKDDG